MQYSEHMFRERAAELTNEPATAWLRENADQPFFLWVHYFDPHAVYMPPEPFRSRYADDLYDGEIAYADSQIGALLDELKELGVRDRTLVVYTADHGEGMGEHGEQTHSLLVHDATLHVPMILNCPTALPQGKVISRQSCLVDVVPTVLALLGEEVPEELDGLNWCQPSAEEHRPVLIETISTMTLHGWAPLVGVRRTDYKYVLAPIPELYDLANDPGELNNLHDTLPATVAKLSAKLVAWLGQDPFLAARKAVDLSNLQVDKEAMRHLAALGYVSTKSEDQEPSAGLADPKEMVLSWETVQKAIHLGAEGDPMGAVALLEPHLAMVPRDVYARTVLGGMYRQLGETERALTQFLRIQEEDPNNATVQLSIANLYMADGKLDDAEKRLQKALELEPRSGNIQIALGQLALSRGRPDEALAYYQKAIEWDPGTTGADAYNRIGLINLYGGRLDDARHAFRNAIKIDSLNGEAHDGLANVLMAEKKMDAAMAELEVALRFDPNQSRVLTSLASLVSLTGDQDRALDLCQRALNSAPKSPTAHNNLGLIYRRRGELGLAEEHFLKAIEFSGHFDTPHVNLAQLYVRQGKSDEALEQFKLAVADNPAFPNAIALANLGAHAYNQGNIQEALVFYGRALLVNPDYALVHKYVATIFARPEINRPDLTVFHLRRTLELDPDQADADDLTELLRRAEEEVARRAQETTAPAAAAAGMDDEVSAAPSAAAAPAPDQTSPPPSADNAADPARP
jgi:Tfp pilus assembly protein PilF